MNHPPGKGAIDYLVIGHITQDITPRGAQLGGTAAYASLLAYRLDKRVGLVTAVGKDLSLSPLRGIAITKIPGKHTTTFIHRYSPQGREQTIQYLAPPLSFQHIPPGWREAPLVHLAPVAKEIKQDLMVKFPRSLLGISLQGWMREWDEKGRVKPSPSTLSLTHCGADCVPVASEEDFGKNLDDIMRFAHMCPLLVVTKGREGTDIFVGGEKTHIPTLPREEVDPTGAGDLFAAALLIHYHAHGDIREAARFATSIAALSVSRRGLEGVPTREELLTLEGVV